MARTKRPEVAGPLSLRGKVWWARYRPPGASRSRRQSTGCRDYEAAKAWLAARELEHVKHGAGIPVARPISLILAVAEFLEARAPIWSKGWAATVEGFMRNELIPYFGESRPVHTITRPDVETFRAKQLGRKDRRAKKGDRTISPTTVNRLMAALAKFGKWCAAKDRHYLLEDPFSKHETHPEDEIVPKVPEPWELAAYLAELPEKRTRKTRAGVERTFYVRALVTFAVETGFRKSELARLAWSDIDTKARRVLAVSSWQRGRNKGKRTREQALSRRALEALASLPRRPDGLVFGPIGDLRKSLHTAGRKAGLGHVWFHLNRHFGATRAGAANATLPELMAWGGWSNPRMVKKYAHADLDRLKALADRVEEMER